jgi:hypothetical protein
MNNEVVVTGMDVHAKNITVALAKGGERFTGGTERAWIPNELRDSFRISTGGNRG